MIMPTNVSTLERGQFGPAWFRIFIGLYAILCGLPSLLYLIFDVQDLVSPSWVMKASSIDAYLSTILICAIGAASLRSWRKQYLSHEKSLVVLSGASFAFMIYVFGIFSDKGPVKYGMPIIAATFFGQEIEVPFTVERAYFHSFGECKNPIVVNRMASSFERVCNSSEEFVASLKPDDAIVVSGKGTQLGLFPDSARRSD
ncbi:hypothetical protein [Roseovarius sp. EL26]|uniref:hypothetical protein n=1 Tax=Roseovarius sp. EL26 TaxID=2126672 RepID=UPI0013C40FCF|nr:hypothetical protein [Roseovarius sp. EL26]